MAMPAKRVRPQATQQPTIIGRIKPQVAVERESNTRISGQIRVGQPSPNRVAQFEKGTTIWRESKNIDQGVRDFGEKGTSRTGVDLLCCTCLCGDVPVRLGHAQTAKG